MCRHSSGWMLIALSILIGIAPSPAHAAWPTRVFAPYMYLGAGDNFKLTDCDDQCGQKFYTLAFIIENKDTHEPAWDGRFPLEQNLYADQIEAIRKRGGDVIVSFGGEAGHEPAVNEENADALLAKYRAVIDRYKFTWLDFDIEGKDLSKTDANERRNVAIAKLQATYPGLIISYTLPVNPDGISKNSQAALADAKAKGVKVHSANIMTMYFGKKFTDGKKLSDVSIASALKAYEQCQSIDPEIKIGLCPNIGSNGEGEVFSVQDAQELKDWAVDKPWICSLSFWSSNRDNGQPGKKNGNTKSGIQQDPWAFSKIFQQITTK